ncbi:MAG: HNH endonuclease [Erythrobacter sp.]|nr:HNH endonuclease [Erythrobacter sp.]
MVVERLRGRAGQRQRQRRLRRTNGLCERCLEQGRTRQAERVNHKVPLIHGGSDEDSNTENLCRPCDLEVTAEQFEFNVAPGARGIDVTGRPSSPDHPWNAGRSGREGGRGSKV